MQEHSINYLLNKTTIFMKKYLSLISSLFTFFLISACSTSQANKLEPFDFKDATRKFRDQQHDTPGVWYCGYRKHKTSENAVTQQALMVEIDEKYLYIKNRNNIIELIRTLEDNETIYYTNTSPPINARIKLLKISNFSEHQESHDRTVEVEVSTPENKYSLQLLGKSCGI
ncbi:hypothetical protein [Pseudomonas sp. OTU750018]|uniref:hypothetical protein n=1 Tax=Pseudomonas sp. OTU750018 TaxID=2709708 RepID=UPI00142286C4|nr:hypothetical protein [Pseudomonas sp. OTU750018]